MNALDHIVVAAATLEEGERWCKATLGVVPAGGGAHPLMGTHNRLLDIGSAHYPRSYLEIIAIDPDAPAPTATKRWFDLDDAQLQARLRRDGPQLVHWALRTRQIDTLAAQVDCGSVQAASRGALQWRITIRADGRRGAGGARPSLIQWGDAHPCDGLPPSGASLRRVEVSGLGADYERLGLADCNVALAAVGPALAVTLDTPRGPLRITT